MAKKRTISNRGYRPIRNANMIGKGGKHIKPVRGSWVKGYNKAMAKPKVKSVPAKSPVKSKTGYVSKKSHSYSKKVRTTKQSPVRQISSKMRQAQKRTTPSPKMKMKTRQPARKPPTRGR